MSGSTLPYALRQNKFVDRRIFIELLGRIERYIPLDDHVYISMGGASLEDHRLAHAYLGLTKMLSFDMDDWIIERQKFNTPVDYIKFMKITSGDLIGSFSAVMSGIGFGGNPSAIMWLDFTSPRDLRQQLGEFHKMLVTMQPCDVVRITVNSSANALYQPQIVGGRKETVDVFAPKRLDRLTDRLGEYSPGGLSVADMNDEGVAKIIARAFGNAARKAYPAQSEFIALPLSAVRYADGQQMLSLTVIVLKRLEVKDFLAKTKLANWGLYSQSWQDIHEIAIPYLSLRERMLFNEHIPNAAPHDVFTKLGFLFDDDEGKSNEIFEQYRKYYRYYPQFHHIQT
ncbi:O-methyltransferase [Methylobacterium nodulans]|uniref:Three-Cys-motif partner protein TcmP n=1 Tax=Methylobacterium nodulans (strain LMG 21967 / CNCM I-2342 / ORS 2060) TaxID=460265 RepID=B8IIG2_METNO|nr:O-methyltransferase [Methylobacterium nodulans]ACL59839.1 conserved hypothetical protein [Methylobacterium nodulans ORS 2060]